MRLCKMKEAEGNLAEASALLQEVQVETSIAMDKIEKAEFILEQMRLVIAREDFIRYIFCVCRDDFFRSDARLFQSASTASFWRVRSSR